MKLGRVLILNTHSHQTVEDRHVEHLKSVSPDTEFLVFNTQAEAFGKCDDADAIITWPSVTPELVEFCKNAKSLKWLHTFTSGLDPVMKSDIWNLPIKITSSKGIHNALEDHALAFIFGFLRQFHRNMRAQLKHHWGGREIGHYCEESFDRTIGIVGLGAIGLELARKCKLLGMKVVGCKRTLIDSEWLDECYTMEQIDEVLKQSDFVVLLIPLTPETTNLMDERAFRIMKKNAVLINLARGAVVDHDALMKALDAGEIAGAGLDIFVKEPLDPGDPLWDYENIMISPHTSNATPHYMNKCIAVAITENIKKFLADQPLDAQWN